MEKAARLEGKLWISYDLFNEHTAQALKDRLTFMVKAFHKGDSDKLIYTYELNDEAGEVGVPVMFGLQLLQKLLGLRRGTPLSDIVRDHVEVNLSNGHPITVPRLPDPYHEKASPNQSDFFVDVIEAMVRNYMVYGEAPTGSGKTVTALNAIGNLGKTALIVVPSREMVRQWTREAKLHLGLADEDIGTVEEGEVHFRGKKIVIALIHTMVCRRLPIEFKRYFGIAVYDESHRYGAEHFSRAMSVVEPRHRLALSATPERRDGLTAVVTDQFGDPMVRADCDAIPCDVRVIDFPTNLPEAKYLGQGALISRLTLIPERNKCIVDIVKTLFKRGRNILVLSDRIEHLIQLADMCAHGSGGVIPAEKMGLYTRKKLLPIEVEDEKGRMVPAWKEQNQTDSELALVRETAQVIFSTYGMGKDAVDIPRLDAGVDATPRADGIQAIGRIRRPLVGKKRPVWFTIRDTTIGKLVGYTKSRLREYQSSNATVIDHGT